MDPAGTVDNFSSSSSTTPTPTPAFSSGDQSSSIQHTTMTSDATNSNQFAVLSQQLQQLVALTSHLQSQLNSLQQQQSPPITTPPTSSQLPSAISGSSASSAVPQAVLPSLLPSHPSPSASLKVATPDPFNGNLARTAEFITSLLLYFHGKGEGVLTDGQKITFALSYMKGGTAGTWAKRKVLQLSKQGQTWDEFLSDLQATFSDPDPVGTARHKIDLLKQGTNSAEEYAASFRELMDDTGFNDAALVDKFEKGLNPSLWTRIRNLSVVPHTLEEWVAESIRLDRQQRMTQQRAKFLMPSLPGRHSSSSSTQSPASTAPRQTVPPARLPLVPSSSSSSSNVVVPMEVDASSKRVGSSSPPVCYRCRRPGHIAKHCTSKVDINSLDFDGLKEHFQKLLNEEAQAKETQDFQ